MLERGQSVTERAHGAILCHFVDLHPAGRFGFWVIPPQGVKVLGRNFESYAGPEARNNFRRQFFFSLPQKMAVKNLPGVKKAACPLWLRGAAALDANYLNSGPRS